MTQPIAIYGAGGQGREVLQLLQQINAAELTWDCLGWFDDGQTAGTRIAGLPVLGGSAELNQWSQPLALVVAIGRPDTKEKIVKEISNSHISYPVLIHPNVLIDKDRVEVGAGSIITQSCILTVDIRIGRHVLLNLGCVLTHDCFIGDYSALMPSVNVSGHVHIGASCYIGTGARIIQQTIIGSHSIIGAGAVVISDIPAHCTAVGVPAKVIKHHQ